MKSTMLMLAVAASFPTAAAATDLRLECEGVAAFTTTTTSSGSIGGEDASLTTAQRQRSRERLTVEITGDQARIRPPNAIIPPINSGSAGGWWTASTLTVGEDEIAAQFRFNVFNKPRVRIDRRSGDISLRGLDSSFSGVCKPADPAARAF